LEILSRLIFARCAARGDRYRKYFGGGNVFLRGGVYAGSPGRSQVAGARYPLFPYISRVLSLSRDNVTLVYPSVRFTATTRRLAHGALSNGACKNPAGYPAGIASANRLVSICRSISGRFPRFYCTCGRIRIYITTAPLAATRVRLNADATRSRVCARVAR